MLVSVFEFPFDCKAPESVLMARLLNTYQLLFENSLDAVLLGRPDGQIIKANPAACTMFRMTEAELCAAGREGIIETNDTRYARFMEERIRLGRARGELRLTRKDGSTFEGEITSIIQDDGQRTVVLIRDITERKRAEAALWESRELLKRAEEIAHLGSWELDLVENVLTWSDEVYRIFGLQPQEFGATYEAFLHAVHPDDRALVNEAYLSSLRENRDSYEVEHRMLQPTGEIRHVHEKCTHLRDEKGSIIRSVGMVHDITERKKKEKEVERLNADLVAHAKQLEEANRDLEMFNYSVAHDLYNPLTLINGYQEAIKNIWGDKLNPECLEFLEHAIDASAKMGKIIDALLRFSQVTRVEIQCHKVDLEVMAREMIKEFTHAEPGRRVDFKVTGNLTAEGDPDLIRVVLANLLGNAWKFTQMREQAIIEFGFSANGEEASFYVRDNGPGFDVTDAEKLFLPFHRSPDTARFRGHGIGLATVARIIERHGGRIWAEGQRGQGATFHFTLPLPDPEH